MSLSTASRLLTTLVLLLLGQRCATADIVTLNFEGFADGTSLTSQYPGLAFTNATIISAGISLNDFEFPPHSGTNVVFDDGGPISVSFATPVASFSGYFTYLDSLTLAGYNAALAEIASARSAFSTNDALFGDAGSSPNEFLSVTFPGGISSVTITGDPAGASFVMDDATYTSTVPEPNQILPSLILFAGVLALRKRPL